MVRCLSVIIAGLSLFVLQAAAQTPSLTLGNATSVPDSVVSLSISVANNGAATGVQFDLTYDGAALTCTDIVVGAAGGTHVITSNETVAGVCRVVVISMDNDLLLDGEMAVLDFMILDDAAAGAEAVTIANVTFIDADAQQIATGALTNGQVTVQADTDKDGLPDDWEQQIIDDDPQDAVVLPPNVNPDADYDGDGWSNKDEFDEDADPTDLNSVPDWQMSLTGKLADGEEILTIGYKTGASNNFDAILDVEAGGGNFVYIKGGTGDLPDELSENFLAPSPDLNWILCAQANNDGDVEVTWLSTDIPSSHNVTVVRLDPDTLKPILDTRSSMAALDRVFLAPGQCVQVNFAPDYIDIKFFLGWNSFSFPFEPLFSDFDDVLENAQAGPFWFWVKGERMARDRFRPAPRLKSKTGYFVYFDTLVPSPTILSIPGLLAIDGPEIAVRKGWNFVGVKQDALIPDDPNIITTSIWYWDAEAKMMKLVQPDELLLKGRAYYIFATQDTTLFDQ